MPFPATSNPPLPDEVDDEEEAVAIAIPAVVAPEPEPLQELFEFAV
jgi:hypothetical protein